MKNIQYNDYSNLEKCKDEPIHLIGSIQPFGVFLAFSKTHKNLTHISENAISFFDLETSKLVEENQTDYHLSYFLKLFDVSENELFTESFLNKNLTFRKVVDISNTPYIISFQCQLEAITVEIEERGEINDEEVYYRQNQEFLKMVNETDDFADFSQLIANNIQHITGYDRVMVYRFDNDYNGEVFAEAIKGSHEPFLGLHYPNSDIPEQARKLYKVNKCRILTDTEVEQVPIYALKNKDKDFDIGGSILRSSSPIHLKYLNNMGVRATLTLSIMIDEQLWGLIACHHYSPKHIGLSKRLSASLQTDFYASQIRRWERSDEYALVQEKEHIYQAIIEDGVKHKNLFKAITNQTYLLGLTSSSGVAVIRDDAIFCFGKSLSAEGVRAIHDFMQERNEHVFLTNELGVYYREAKAFKELVSGLLYYRLDIEGASAIMWFRTQLSEGKKWGGEPNFDDKNVSLTPRSSFEAWEEKVDGKSAIWRSHEIQAGLRLCAFLEREIYINSLKEQKKKFELLTTELKEANEELSQFNWISSHDMKEPLRKIRLFVDQIKGEENLLTKTHQAYFSRIDAAAEYMQNLINDLLNYSSLTKQENYSEIDIKRLLTESFKDLNEEIIDVELTIDEDAIVFGVKLHLKQVLMNILSNSVKFSSPSRALKIKINMEKNVSFPFAENKDQKYMKLSIKDNGIGFSQEYNERIFKVFQRLHNQQQYKGTGIGLALCKKIMESHNGHILAEGVDCQGATFSLYFPQNE